MMFAAILLAIPFVFCAVITGAAAKRSKSGSAWALCIGFALLGAGLSICAFTDAAYVMNVLCLGLAVILLGGFVLRAVSIKRCTEKVSAKFAGFEERRGTGKAAAVKTYFLTFEYNFNGKKYCAQSASGYFKSEADRIIDRGICGENYVYINPKKPDKPVVKKGMSASDYLMLLTGVLMAVMAFIKYV